MTSESGGGTANQKLAELLLGQPLAAYVASRRDEGLTWRAIAGALATATDGLVAVSHETLRQWFAETDAA